MFKEILQFKVTFILRRLCETGPWTHNQDTSLKGGGFTGTRVAL